jgi:hypothetical protein
MVPGQRVHSIISLLAGDQHSTAACTRGTLSGSWHCDPDCDLQRCGQLKARQLQARMLCCAWPHHHDGSCCVISVDAMLGVFIYVFMLAISVGIVSVFSTHLVQHREFLHLAVSIR